MLIRRYGCVEIVRGHGNFMKFDEEGVYRYYPIRQWVQMIRTEIFKISE